MGGFGSGGYWWWRSTHALVERHRSLDVSALKHAGVLSSACYATLAWRDERGRVVASMGIFGGSDSITLSYSVQNGNSEPQAVSEAIRISWTRCHLGGQRAWFICPGLAGRPPCQRRASKLYLGSRYFLCRRCLDLVYASQNEDAADRILRRMRRIRRRLGGGVDVTRPVPLKPQGMHWATYEDLVEELRELDRRYLPAVLASPALARLMTRHL